MRNKRILNPNRYADWSFQKRFNFNCDFPSLIEHKTKTRYLLDDWTDLAAFAFQIVTGMDLPFLGHNNSQPDFDQLNDNLKLITDQLTAITGKLENILTRIAALPDEIRGIFNAENLRRDFTNITTSCQLIRPLLRDRNVFTDPENFTLIGIYLKDLAGSINLVVGATGGKMAGFSITASGFAVWVQTKTMVLNERPSGRNNRTIWDEDFFTAHVKMIRDLFTTADNLAVKYQTDLPNIPGPPTGYTSPQQWVYSSGSFRPHTYPAGVYYEPDNFFCPPFYGPLRLYSSVNRPPVPPLNSFFDPAEEGYFESFEHPNVVREAAAVWNTTLVPELIDIRSFQKEFKDFQQIRDKVYAALTPPTKSTRKRKRN